MGKKSHFLVLNHVEKCSVHITRSSVTQAKLARGLIARKVGISSINDVKKLQTGSCRLLCFPVYLCHVQTYFLPFHFIGGKKSSVNIAPLLLGRFINLWSSMILFAMLVHINCCF